MSGDEKTNKFSGVAPREIVGHAEKQKTGGRTGRPKKNPDEILSKQYQVYLTEKEGEALDTMINKTGLSTTAIIRLFIKSGLASEKPLI